MKTLHEKMESPRKVRICEAGSGGRAPAGAIKTGTFWTRCGRQRACRLALHFCYIARFAVIDAFGPYRHTRRVLCVHVLIII